MIRLTKAFAIVRRPEKDQEDVKVASVEDGGLGGANAVGGSEYHALRGLDAAVAVPPRRSDTV